MHKNIPVVDIILDEITGSIREIYDVHYFDHLPIGIGDTKDKINLRGLNAWFLGRRIPSSRQGIKDALEQLGYLDTAWLIEKCFGLSLSDQYWINPIDKSLEWKDINFFTNDFSEDMGDLMFGQYSDEIHWMLKDNPDFDLMSPDNTSDGWLKKKWKIIDGKRYLIKAGSNAYHQEAYNEVIATRIMERLGVNHVPYHLLVEDDEPYSVCENFITPDTELVTAAYILNIEPKENHVSKYQHFLALCSQLGISNVQEEIDKMLVIDYLIVNIDRHLNNFGAVRHAETLEWVGVAPIFDSGASFWFDTATHILGSAKHLKSKPFKNKHHDQIKLVKNFNWLDLSKLDGIEEEVRDIFAGSVFVDEVRREAIVDGLGQRITDLQEIIDRYDYSVDEIRQDVKEHESYSGNY